MTVQDFDLFRTRVKVIDHEDDPELNRQVLDLARRDATLNDSGSGRNLLKLDHLPWLPRLKTRFDRGLALYLKDVQPRAEEPFEIDAYMFLNSTEGSAFTPYHNHLIGGDLVAIYYVCCPAYAREARNHSYESLDESYYALDEGVLVLQDPKPALGIDYRSVETAPRYVVYPRPNRMVIHPSGVGHSVSPSGGGPRLAVTCDFIINKSKKWRNYLCYSLEVPSP